ncbi:MAG: TolC family protein [Bacteroidota bacterium]|jgi:outer membrane protein TolC|nr:TolC family protein [Prolixibacteraceae bacterium]MDI9563779.1 TolC family protein [Bacteroidota bacterium]OQB81606.1 MAG: Outer membrane protein TolC precursor [Bacteroidetes bacterium ADurb.Bin123]HNU77851.1 TolC family protein [Prolixibacteraceae bacterium]HNZ68781.1 TolC family protein [Prolixibacteraceae bacterium]
MKVKQISLMVMLGFLTMTLPAREVMRLDLEGARKQAILYNKTLKNAGMAVDKSVYQLKEAISAGLPQVSSTLDYTNALGAKLSIRFVEDAPPTEIPIRPTSNFNLQVGQLLFNGPYFVGIELAKLGKSLMEKSYEKSEQDILAQVTGGYNLVLMSRELLDLLNRNVTNFREVYNKTSALVSAGILEQTDLDQLGVQIASLGNSVRSSERQLELAKNMLRLQLGLTIDQDFEVLGTLDQALLAMNGISEASGPFDVNRNPDFQLLGLQENLTQKQVRLQYAAFLPTLTGFYNRTEKILKPDFDMSPKNMVGLNLSIPIFSGGQQTAKLKQAKIELETMQNTRELLAEQLEVQEKQLRFNLKNANETYLNQVTNLDVARRVYSNLKLKFEQGMISALDLVTADNNYLRAETEYLTALFQVLQAKLDLDKINGNLK